MKPLVFVASAMFLAAGCENAATRAWQRAPLGTHDRQLAFNAAQEVLGKHFEVARASFVQGTIETKPQVFDRKREGTLSDLRGAGGRWRRIVSFEIERESLEILGRVAVRLERENTAGAFAIAETGGYEARAVDVPRSQPLITESGARPGREVWVEVGYDTSLAREIVSEIASHVAQMEKGEAMPADQSPEAATEETRKYMPQP